MATPATPWADCYGTGLLDKVNIQLGWKQCVSVHQRIPIPWALGRKELKYDFQTIAFAQQPVYITAWILIYYYQSLIFHSICVGPDLEDTATGVIPLMFHLGSKINSGISMSLWFSKPPFNPFILSGTTKTVNTNIYKHIPISYLILFVISCATNL